MKIQFLKALPISRHVKNEQQEVGGDKDYFSVISCPNS